MIGTMHAIVGALLFCVGASIGSFLNVCIYRLPWQKSIVWPSSRCLSCYEPVASRDNLPIASWFILRGECRHCGARFSPRYAWVELLVGLLWLAVYLVDVAHGASLVYAPPVESFVRMFYHQIMMSLLVVATFIDFDHMVIPDEATVTGMLLGVLGGWTVPGIRPEPATAATHTAGLVTGLLGLAAGGAIVWVVRFLGSKAFGREAMGFGDVTLLAMIGAFLGWQAAVLTFFLSPFFGLVPALLKIVVNLAKRLAGHKLSGSDREIPFGPCLSMAAVTIMLSCPWLWKGWARQLFETSRIVFLFLTGQDT